MSVFDLLALFCQSLVAKNRSPRTVEWYRHEVKRFFDWLEKAGLHHGNWLAPDIIERYLADARAAGNAPATVSGHYRALVGWFGWLVRRGYLESSPMAMIEAPHVPHREPKRTAIEEYIALLDSIPEGDWVNLRDRLIVQTLFLCGIRLGECTKLTAADYRTKEHLLRVDGKTGERVVPLQPAVERAFVAYVYERPASLSDRLFLAANGARQAGKPITEKGIYQMIRRHCQRAGIRNLNPHSFRHGLAMYLLNEGGDMSFVQRVLGHAQIGTTARHYADWLTEGLQREFADKMRGLGQ